MNFTDTERKVLGFLCSARGGGKRWSTPGVAFWLGVGDAHVEVAMPTR